MLLLLLFSLLLLLLLLLLFLLLFLQLLVTFAVAVVVVVVVVVAAVVYNWPTDKRRQRAISVWLLNAARCRAVKPSSFGISMRPGYLSAIFCTALQGEKKESIHAISEIK